MLTTFQLVCLLAILAATFAGGYYPLFRQDKARAVVRFPLGEAFTAGVFIALAMLLMLPSAIFLVTKAFSTLNFPLAEIIAIGSFLLLLGIEHVTRNVEKRAGGTAHELLPPAIPLIMTAMIAVPSFFLGVAFGVSPTNTAILIFIAIIMHKTSAAFALALKMVRSTMKPWQVRLAFCAFALSTPLGILAGGDIHVLLGAETLRVVKGAVLALAAGTFLYMGTLHEHRDAPMIRYCTSRRGFATMLAGFFLTALVRLIIGEAHRLG